MRTNLLSAIGLGLLAAASGSWAQEKKPGLNELTGGWRSDNVGKRDEATRRVLEGWETWTADELRHLETLAADRDPEVRARAKAASQRGEICRRWGRALCETIEDLKVLDGSAGAEAQLQLLARLATAADEGKLQESALERFSRDQAKIWGWAEEKPRQIAFYETLHRKSFGALIVPLVKEGTEHRGKGPPYGWAARWLVGMDARHCAPEIALLLKEKNALVRYRAAWVLGELGAKEHAGDVLPLVRDKDARVRIQALETLGQFGVKEVAPEIAPLLKEPWDASTRGRAAQTLGRIGAKEYLPDIVAMLRPSDLQVNNGACLALVQLGAREHARDILPLLKHEDSYTRAVAVRALGDLGANDQVREIVPLLKDSSDNVRNYAITVIGEFGALQYAGEILPFLNDEGWWVRRLAFQSLGKMKTKGHREEIAALIRGLDFERDSRKPHYVVGAACLELPGGEVLAERVDLKKEIRSEADLKNLFKDRSLKIEGPPGLKMIILPTSTWSWGDIVVSVAQDNKLLFTFQDGEIKLVEWEEGKRWWSGRLKE